MNDKIVLLIMSFLMILIGILNIIFGRQWDNFLDRLGVDSLPGDSPDESYGRGVMVSIIIIILGISILVFLFT